MRKGLIKIVAMCVVLFAIVLLALSLTGCTQAERAQYNLSIQADNFNIMRKLTAINARSDEILFEVVGTFSLKNNGTNELEVICEVGPNEYKKHFVYLNEWTIYVVEDISGANVDPYHYEINILPQMIGGAVITMED